MSARGPGGSLRNRAVAIVMLLLAAFVGFWAGTLLTAPVVGWPHAFPGLLRHAPERLREAVGWTLVIAGVIGVPLVLWRVALRRLWRVRQ